jgi:hypothetical protein
MKTVLGGFAVAVLLAVAVGYLFPRIQEPAYRAFSTQSVRVGDPGSNLVGPNWSGEGQVRQPGQSTASSTGSGSGTGSSHD